MATTAQTFFLTTTEQDFTAGGELDIRKLVEAAEANDNSTSASFDTAAAEIILDPYTNRSTTGTADAANFGWAVNRLGSDGMDSTSAAKRIIPAGSWAFQGRLATLAATSTYRIRWRVYRASSSGTRTLLFGPINSQSEVPVSTGTLYTATSSQSQVTLEANETILVSWAVDKTNTSLTAEGCNLDTNGNADTVCKITVPSPGVRTLRFQTATVAATGAATLVKLKTKKAFTVTGSNAVAFARRITARRSFTVAGSGAVEITKKHPRSFTVAGSAAVALFVKIKEDILERITGGGGVETVLGSTSGTPIGLAFDRHAAELARRTPASRDELIAELRRQGLTDDELAVILALTFELHP